MKHHLNQSYQLKVIYPDTHFCYVSTVTLDLGDKTFDQGHDILVGHGHQLCNCVIQIQHGSNELWPGHGFWLSVHCNLDDMT